MSRMVTWPSTGSRAFGQRVGVRPQPAARAGREDHSYQPGLLMRDLATVGCNHPLRKSQQKSTKRYPASAAYTNGTMPIIAARPASSIRPSQPRPNRSAGMPCPDLAR